MRIQTSCEHAIAGEAIGAASSYKVGKALREAEVEREVLRLQGLVGAERDGAAAEFLRSMDRFLGARVRWFVGDDVDADELRQVAEAALWRAVESWRPGGGRGFLAFARWGIRNALGTFVNGDRQVRCGRRLDVVSLDDEDAAEDSPALDLADEGDDPEAALLRRERVEAVRAAMSRLPAEHRQVLAAVAGGAQVKAVGRRAWERAQEALRRELRRLGDGVGVTK